MRRRLRFSTLILITQMLLIALSIAWLFHMVIIAIYGSIYFVEYNPFILWAEISASVLITVFAVVILTLQIQRLGERRSTDRRNIADRRQ
jgi:membrane protein implicated in regulation of membrane protease activity